MTNLLQNSAEFLAFIEQWQTNLGRMSLAALLEQPARAAIVAVDVTNGFCVSGALASPRVAQIVAPITRLMTRGWELGLRRIVLAEDTHEPDALEFAQWPAHCVRGSREAEPVDALQALPFFEHMTRVPKNSIHPGLNTGLSAWTDAHPEVDTFIVVGDCTDLCTYQLAMHLRLEANARQLRRRVILPADAVATYDRPVTVAREQGGLPHPGDLMHAVFLYHMALNGVEVAAGLE